MRGHTLFPGVRRWRVEQTHQRAARGTPARLKSFDEVSRQEGTLNRLPPRYAAIAVQQVVGSLDAVKVASLTPSFQPETRRGRYYAVLEAMRHGAAMPPIEVYALRGDYYVVDGHHRVAAARSLGYPDLDALVHEVVLPPTSVENTLYNQRLHFERATGLTAIEVSDVSHYQTLRRQIVEHAHYLASNGKAATLAIAAADWQEYVYAPLAQRLVTSAVLRHFAGRTVADVYVALCDYKWVQSQRRGLDIGFAKALSDFERLYPPPRAEGGRRAPFLRALRRPVERAVSPQ